VATVYGASRFEQKVTEAPSTVSIVTSDDIKKYGYRNLADILRSQRGFFITYDRNYAFVGARGVDRSGGYNNRILVLVDGHRTNENMYDTAFVGNEFILDLDLIDRVEIIRGPGSSLYGDNAFFAVINILTRHERTLQGLETSVEGGSLDSYKGRLSYGNRFANGLALSLSGTIYDSQGHRALYYHEFDDASHNNGIARNLDYEHNYSLFGTAALRDFTLQGAYVSRTKGVPTASFGAAFNDPRFLTVDNRGYLDLKYEHSFAEVWETAVRGYYDQYYYHENIPVDADAPGGTVILNRDSALNRWWGGELKVSRTLGKNRLIAGSEYQDNLTQLFDNHDIAPYQRHLEVDHPTWRWAAYFQDELTISPQLILNAGLRYDHYNTFGGTFNPRVAAIYSPFQGSSLKALYGEAFRAPNSYELYYGVAEFEQKGNPALQPEKIRSYSLVWEQSVGEHVRTTAVGFYNTISKMIRQQSDPADGMLVFENLNTVTAKGLELEVEGKWQSGVQGRASYTLQDARDDVTRRILVDSPRQMAKLNLSVPLYRKSLFSGVELQYLGRRKTLAGNYTSGYFLTNLTLFSQNLWPGLELSGTLYNVFDRIYQDPGSGEHRQDAISQDGRSFRLKLEYRF
jgi:outer membrane receptor for ferrienterochelin and colicins